MSKNIFYDTLHGKVNYALWCTKCDKQMVADDVLSDSDKKWNYCAETYHCDGCNTEISLLLRNKDEQNRHVGKSESNHGEV